MAELWNLFLLHISPFCTCTPCEYICINVHVWLKWLLNYEKVKEKWPVNFIKREVLAFLVCLVGQLLISDSAWEIGCGMVCLQDCWLWKWMNKWPYVSLSFSQCMEKYFPYRANKGNVSLFLGNICWYALLIELHLTKGLYLGACEFHLMKQGCLNQISLFFRIQNTFYENNSSIILWKQLFNYQQV